MKLYLVRHGESVLTDKKHQPPDVPLSEAGIKQAVSIAQRFSNIPLDAILTSSYVRAVQTANEIGRTIPVNIIKSDLLDERKMPSVFYGKNVDDPSIVSVHQLIRENFYKPEWHYGDEENFHDLRQRGKEAFKFILSQQKENIAVVTHGYFLVVLVYIILFGENINSRQFQAFREHVSNSNTGLTVCEYLNNKWKLITWNDIAHLGE